MIVYTVQTEEAWKQFKKLGYLEGNKEVHRSRRCIFI